MSVLMPGATWGIDAGLDEDNINAFLEGSVLMVEVD